MRALAISNRSMVAMILLNRVADGANGSEAILDILVPFLASCGGLRCDLGLE